MTVPAAIAAFSWLVWPDLTGADGKQSIAEMILVEEPEKSCISYWAWSKIKNIGMKQEQPLKKPIMPKEFLWNTQKKKDISHCV